MEFKQMVDQIFTELGAAAPDVNLEKTYSLPIGKNNVVQIRELASGFSLYSPVILCPTSKREELFTYLMRANFLSQGTGGARIGLDADEKYLTLSLGFTYEMNYQGFRESVEEFVNYVMYWSDAVAQFMQEK